jgi:hypothetical protein
VVLDLGDQPHCGYFPPGGAPVATYPLRMWLCRQCGLAQLVGDAAVDEEPVGATPQAVRELAVRNLGRLVSAGLLAPGMSATEFGSPHGTSWNALLNWYGLRVVRAHAAEAGDLVFDVYGLLHERDQAAALARRVALLKPGGTVVFQLHSLATTVRCRQWTELRHGHYAYWSAPALAGALRGFGLGIHRAWWDPLDGGTLLLAACGAPEPDTATVELLASEQTSGVERSVSLRSLQRGADEAARSFRDWLRRCRVEGEHRVAGYGAAGRAVPLLCHAGVDPGLLAMVGDASAAKQGCVMPGSGVPIVPPHRLAEWLPTDVVVFLPDLLAEMRQALPEVEDGGGRWLVLGSDGVPAELAGAAVSPG